MKSQILVLLLVSSVFQGAFTQNCGAAACSGNFCDRPGTHTSAGCVAANANCASGYARATPGSDIAANNACSSCATTHALNALSAAATACIAKTVVTGGLCATGYTDKSDGAAAAAVGGTLAGDCSFCVATSHAFNAVPAAATACIAKTITGGVTCATGYTDKADGAPATTTGSLAGDCKYCVATTNAANALSGDVTKCVAKTIANGEECLTGYTDKSNGGAPTTGNGQTLAGDCKYCISTHIFNAIPAAATRCIPKTIANGKLCATGYTDKANGGTATAVGTAADGDCKYCLSTTHAFNAIPASATACIAKTVVSGGQCAMGYTDKSDGTAATAVGGTLAGDCKFCLSTTHAANAIQGAATKCVTKTIANNDGCLTGYTDQSSGAAATSGNGQTLTGDCKFCLTTHTLNALPAAATACIAKSISGGVTCAAGYTDKSNGAAATTTGNLEGDCKFCLTTHVLNARSAAATKCVAKTIGADGGCLTGYTDKADGSAASTTTLTGNCDYCVTGYTLNSSTGLCVQNTPASSSVIAYGVFLIAALFAALF